MHTIVMHYVHHLQETQKILFNFAGTFEIQTVVYILMNMIWIYSNI
jgi:hypothetical protein